MNSHKSGGHAVLRLTTTFFSGWNLFLPRLNFTGWSYGKSYERIVPRNKRKLYSGRKDDPATRVEVRVDKDVFDEGLALAGKSKKEREKTVYRVSSNHTLNNLLRIKWNERIFNENGDYAFVTGGTVRFWLSKKTPIQELQVIGGNTSDQK